MGRHEILRTLAALAMTVAVAGCSTGPAAQPFSGAPSPSRVPDSPDAAGSRGPASTGTAAPPQAASPPATAPTPSQPSPPAAAATWVPAGSLNLGRASTHAVRLSDGRVLVVGNENICTPGGAWDDSVKAELFDPAAGAWKATGSLNAARDSFTAAALPNGRVLVAGGLTSGSPATGTFGAYSSAKLYDPTTGRWTGTGLLKAARMSAAGAPLPDGTVLVAGGTYVDDTAYRTLKTVEIYDPDNGAWSRGPDLGAARSGAQAVALADGRILVVGGTGPSSGDRPFARAEIFDPAAGAWSPAGTLALARDGFSLVALPDGGALVAGGTFLGADGIETTTASAERLDPRTLRWSDAGSMATAAANRSAIVLGDGRVLVAGGIGNRGAVGPGGPDERRSIAGAELYDPAIGTWSATTPLPEGRESGQLVTLPDQSVLLVGGDRGYLGEPSSPWCPEPIPGALRYVPGNAASFPQPTPGPAAGEVAMSSVARAPASPAQARKAAASINAFGIDLYRRMLADGTLGLATKNAVFSPTSIALALGMARAGAKGETAAQMDRVLHTSGWAALGSGLNALDQALSSRAATWKDEEGATHELKLRIANAAFAQRGWPIVQGYLDAIAAAFGSGLRLLDYQADPEAARKTINAWVKQKTVGRIPDLIPKEPPSITGDTRLVLVNAIHLKANWEIEFPREQTRPARFTRLDGSSVQVPTMSLDGGQTVPLAGGRGWKATELRYLGGADRYGDGSGPAPLAMTLIMPDNLPAFEKEATPKDLAGVISKLEAARKGLAKVTYKAGNNDGDCGKYPYSLRLFMPKFGIDTAAHLAGLLKQLGMPLAFDAAQADFTGIHVPEDPLERIHVSQVIHQANIDVDEKGTEAAAATAVVMATGGCTGPDPARTVTLRLDKPFLFVLRDVQTGAILFMGRVVDPSVK